MNIKDGKKLISILNLTTQINNKIEEIVISLTNSPKSTADLMNGKAGEMLFWAYYSRLTKNKLLENKIIVLLNNIFDEIKKGFNKPTFALGLAGVGWSVEHLVKNGFINADIDEIIDSLDDNLYPYMIYFIKEGKYDYLHGALGIGLYYLNRSPKTKIIKYISDLVDELENQSKNILDGITWETTQNPDSKSKGYNLSMSHGIASIISFLCHTHKAGVKVDKSTKLAIGAINYLLQNKQDTSKFKYQFPTWICDVEPNYSGRLAWCYSDLGISIALWLAGNEFENEYWKKEAIKIALFTTKYTEIKDTQIRDVGLCHGAAGVAHIYLRMYKYTNIETFKNSAIYWFEKCLEMATFEDGVAGFKAFRLEKYGGYQNKYGLLEGIIGIGLALLAAISDDEPKWDECLLLS